MNARKKIEAKQPIIIKKVIRKGHGGHHGGAWKVAYADFMTSLLALFIVLWVIGQDQKVRQAVAEYFKNPDLTPKEVASRVEQAEKALREKAAQNNIPMPTSGPRKHKGLNATLEQKNSMVKLKEQLFEVLAKLDVAEATRKQVTIDLTDEGLRISLVDRADSPFFEVGGAEPRPHTRQVLGALAGQLRSLPNRLVIEGHTDARPFGSGASYSNWELSADRANSTRRFLLSHGLRSNQVFEVRGYADQNLHNPANPMDHRNRRVGIIVKYLEGPAPGTEGFKAPEGTRSSSAGRGSKSKEAPKPAAPAPAAPPAGGH